MIQSRDLRISRAIDLLALRLPGSSELLPLLVDRSSQCLSWAIHEVDITLACALSRVSSRSQGIRWPRKALRSNQSPSCHPLKGSATLGKSAWATDQTSARACHGRRPVTFARCRVFEPPKATLRDLTASLGRALHSLRRRQD